MIRKYILPALALIGICLGILMVLLGSKKVEPAKPVAQPSQSPWNTFVSGAGIVEASTENIAIGTQIAGIVREIYVGKGSKVKTGDPLFLIDDRQTRAQLAVAQTAVEVARAQYANSKNQLDFAESLSDKRALSVQEITNRRYNAQSSNANLQQAIAEVNSIQTTLDILTVRAPIDGEILQLNIHLGEFAQTGVLVQPLILMGCVNPMSVRIDIDENDAWRVEPNAPAVAYLRGNRNISTSLKYVRFEPYVVPKRNLTGDTTERVDTRVLQVIYNIEKSDLPIYVGQLMDIYIKAPPHGEIQSK
ncbi:MAG: efflux RND transporter periplasmic adaptor subunit [Phycisphaerales bacterium]